ncbi:MAG: zinc ribbon domain-containing protein [Bacteroidales bacterium]|nr:zinc ribbon domain-containing protein [Bacteroidales bacterium]
MNKVCPNCKNAISNDDLLCPHCNELILDDPQEGEKFICPVCGAENPPGTKSCKFCCSILPETFG